MSLLFAAALAASATTVPACSWDRPGVNPFVGNVVAAVDRYGDIPAPVRAALKKRMGERQYDDIAVIRRDTVAGKHRYSPEIRDMHFGQGQVCRTVTRAQWTTATEERVLVYCESGHCIIVPTVCRNVSRVTRLAPDGTAGGGVNAPTADAGPRSAGAESPSAASPELLSTAAAESEELQFDAPGAGQSFAQRADPAQPGGMVTPLSGPESGGGMPVSGPTGGGVGLPGGGSNPGALDTGGPQGTGGGLPPVEPVPTGPDTGTPFTPDGPLGPFRPDTLLPPLEPVAVVPEPGTWALWLLGLATLAGAARRRRSISS